MPETFRTGVRYSKETATEQQPARRMQPHQPRHPGNVNEPCKMIWKQMELKVSVNLIIQNTNASLRRYNLSQLQFLESMGETAQDQDDRGLPCEALQYELQVLSMLS